jgi:primosomal protein N' (replication factor Y)
MPENRIIQVAIAIKAEKCVFDYRVNEKVAIGQIVEVPLRNKSILGVVWSMNQPTSDEKKIKNIIKIYQNFTINPAILQFINKLAKYTINSVGSFLKILVNRKFLEILKIHAICLNKHHHHIKLSRIAEKICHFIEMNNFKISKKLLLKEFSYPQIKNLLGQGIISEIIEENIFTNQQYNFSLPELNIDQRKIYDQMYSKGFKDFSCSLLSGVTGSGKTEIYLKITQDILTNNNHGQVLILIPEIMLTNNMVQRFSDRFGGTPFVWHSDIAQSVKKEIWQRVASGQSVIVVGTRSALFLPYANLKLIILDEEHDSSYKQEEGIIYNARDAAVLLAHELNIPIILCSATPSIESYWNSKIGKYLLYNLSIRHKNISLPNIHVVDLKKANLERNKFVSDDLKYKISEELSKGKQILVFLNRKGFAPINICVNCGYKYQCNYCSTYLVYHQEDHKFQCHHCGFSLPSDSSCISCKTKDSIKFCGAGVERIYQEIFNYFPDKRILVLTSDSFNKKDREKIFEDIKNKNIDIIIGTQVIGKGYHFPNISLVGVVDADIGLIGADLRSAEKSFQIIQQVVGRSGREEAGYAILQSYFPDSELINALKKNDIEEFYKKEINLRKVVNLPPFKRLIAIIVSSANKELLNQTLKLMLNKVIISKNITILGPVEAPIFKIRGKYRYRFLIKALPNVNLQQYIQKWLEEIRLPNKVILKIDVDPYNFL